MCRLPILYKLENHTLFNYKNICRIIRPLKLQLRKISWMKVTGKRYKSISQRMMQRWVKGWHGVWDLALAKRRQQPSNAMYCRTRDSYLLEFEEKVARRSALGKRSEEATAYINRILKSGWGWFAWWKGQINDHRRDRAESCGRSVGCESVETGFGRIACTGRWWTALPSVTPAMHRSKGDIAKLFNEKFSTPIDRTPEEMTEYVRQVLRKKYASARLK